MKEKLKGKFKYVVLFVILFIPFIYSFFYLKAYWNPYGKGNIDNLPVAIVNLDTGDKGESLVNGIKDSKKLKVAVVSSEKADDGLNDGTYYAVIKVPKTFTSDMESASTTNKKHATITYSPNQKSNYLASQIINNVVLNVEKNLDNEVNSKIVKGLTDSLEEVPTSLDKVNNGFDKLSDGTNKLKNGSKEIVDGSNELASNYSKFNDGVNDVNKGTNTLSSSINKLNSGINTLDSEVKKFDSLKVGVGRLQTGVSTLKTGSDTFTTKFNSYVDGVDTTLGHTQNLVDLINSTICPKVKDRVASEYETQMCLIAQGLSNTYKDTGTTIINYLKISGNTLKSGNSTINNGINDLNNSASGLSSVSESIDELQTAISQIKSGSNQINNGASTLNNGTNLLNINSNKIFDGINTLNSANSTLNDGILTLNSSVNSAKNELASKTKDTKDSVKKVETLSEYSSKPINVETKEVNKVSSYGTAFTPLFVSVGLWVGCLMMFMVLYYDKEERFGIFSINDNRLVKKTLAYHGLITLSSVVLALCLDLFLDFDITNYALYYGSFILIANAFMAIILFLITNFKDIGKFIALILLVLQLGASAGTFPIETVTKGFRWMNPFLPMTYSIRLIKESVIKIDSKLLTGSIETLIIIFIAFFIINITKNIVDEKKTK